MTRRPATGLVLLLLAACVTSRPTGLDAASHRSGAPRAGGQPMAVVPPRAATARPSAERARPRPVASARAWSVDPAAWAPELTGLIGDRPASVSVAIGGRLRFSHLGAVPRAPASNEKLLLSMALLDRFGRRARIPTTLGVRGRVRGHVVRGDLWLVGHGDPEVGDEALGRLAERLRDAGVRRIAGSILGDTSTFRRERWAPGWHRIALSYVALPTALTYRANVDGGGYVFDPEERAAAALTEDAERLGIDVRGTPGDGRVPTRTRTIARVRSAPLVDILRRQNASSLNLYAEILVKRLGAASERTRGSIAAGARAIRRWAARYGVRVVARDGSGLSYENRISTDGFVRLLSMAERAPWGAALRSTLPAPGTGTLAGRLTGIDVRAKTGTLIDGVSALSGWVRLRSGAPAAFSILSAGMAKDDAVALENAVVRFLATQA
jgi:D-alanyl-D-alanine carboxypeptidase/D-alanyl-D-alanine-endopeptidase (penicillin-binding protein 4)